MEEKDKGLKVQISSDKSLEMILVERKNDYSFLYWWVVLQFKFESTKQGKE